MAIGFAGYAATNSAFGSDFIYRKVEITHILSGDSFIATIDRSTSLKVVIHGIKAPAVSEPYSKESVKRLELILSMFSPTLACHDKDRHKRSVCRVYAGNVDVGLEQVRNGSARWNKNSNQDLEEKEAYRHSQQLAQQSRLGLWSNPASFRQGTGQRQIIKKTGIAESNDSASDSFI